jgi:HSP20 family protein
MVIRRRKPGIFEMDTIFDRIEEQFRRSMEKLRDLIEMYIPSEEIVEGEFRTPLADIIDEGDKYVIEVELPGMSKEDIEIYTYDHTLEIVARRKAERKIEKEGVLRLERAYAGFRRVFSLPLDADPENIKAKYENGLLRIEVGKKGEEKGRRRVSIE